MPEAPLRSMDSIGEGATALMYACQQGREREVRAILAKKPNAAEERDRTRKTALHYCAENATPACADAVLRASPGLMDAADEDGYTPLHLAVIAGNGALVRHLLAAGADVDCRDQEQHSVVHWATVCGEVEALDIVLAAGARVSSPDVHGGYPVHYAAQMCGPNSEMGNDVRFGLAVLRRLLQAPGVDVNVRDRDGRQPILWAASAGSADAILALVNAGANVEAEDKDGLTALHCAASRGHTDCLETLLTLCGAEVDVIDSHGCTALFYAATLGHADATRLLLSHGADPNRQDRKGRTPVHCGAAKGQLETLRLLAAHGASLWLRNVRGDLPLHDAVASGRTELVRWLIKQRPDSVDAPNNDGRCPLHVAAIHNNVEMCKVILDQQALLNPVMRSGRGAMLTPLDAALHRGNRGCAKYLQLHGGVPASRLTDKTARLRGATHRVETPTELRFMTPEVQPSRTGVSLANSPLQLGTELSRSESRTLQVRVSDDVAIRRVERLEPCKHHVQRSDSSGDERVPRRRRQRRSRHDSDYSSEVSDVEVSKNRHRKDRRGSASDASRRRRSRHAEDDTHRRPHGRHRTRPRSSSPTSHSTESEDASHRKTSVRRASEVLQVEKEPRKRASRKQSAEEEQTSEYSSDESEVEVTKETVQKHRKEEVTKTKTVKRTEQSSTTDKERRKQKVVKKVAGSEKQDGTANDKSVKRADDKLDTKKKQVSSNKQQQKATDTKKITQCTKNSKKQKENSTEKMLSKTTSEDTEKTEDTQTSSSTTVAREILKTVSTERTISAEEEEESCTEKKESIATNVVEEPSSVSDKVNGESSAVEKESQPQRFDSFNTTSIDEGSTHQVVTVDVHHEAGDDDDEVVGAAQDKTTQSKIQENGAGVVNDGEEISLNESVKTETTCMSAQTREETAENESVRQALQGSVPANENEPTPLLTEENIEPITENVETVITKATENNERSEERFGQTRNDETNSNFEDIENIKEENAQATPQGSQETKHPVSEAESTEVRSNMEDEGKGSEEHTNNSQRADSERSDSKAEDESFEQPSGDEGDSDNEGSIASSHSGKSKDEEDTSTRSPSSALPDSGFEPSPRRDQPGQDSQSRTGRISRPCRENGDERPPVNTVSVTQAVQNSMRKYHLERRIFQQLLELKRLQIRAGRANEQVLVKRLVDDYRRAGLTVGLKGYEGSYTFRAFEKYLYDQLRTLQSAERRLIPRLKSSDDLEKLSAVLRRARFNNTLPPEDPALCTHGTHRCHHAAHAYTGIPCAAYIGKPNHHTQPKATFLPRLVPRRKPVTLELDPGGRHVIALPTERMGRTSDKRYYVSFTIKGGGERRSATQETVPGHRHAKSL